MPASDLEAPDSDVAHRRASELSVTNSTNSPLRLLQGKLHRPSFFRKVHSDAGVSDRGLGTPCGDFLALSSTMMPASDLETPNSDRALRAEATGSRLSVNDNSGYVWHDSEGALSIPDA